MSELKQKILIEGMHCNACEKTISRTVKNLPGIFGINVNHKNKIAEVSFDSEKASIQQAINAIKSKGYKASIYNGNEQSIENEKTDENSFEEKFSHFGVGIFTNFEKFHVERKLLIFSFVSLLIVFGLQYAAYFGFFKSIPNFSTKFAPYLAMLAIAVVANAATIWHTKAYQGLSCISNCMVGMTTGMISGITIGVIIGATNGMFVGTLVGMIVGISTGLYTGRCCGIMGALEGSMAGFMSGLMGAMLSVMLFNDNLLLFLPIFLIAAISILAGLMFFVYKESNGESMKKANEVASEFLAFLVVVGVITIALTFLMVWGPKSAILRLVAV
ncbi:MAG: heavy-metal-associated domain-containing protein [archaeon]|nr:heavy-metal-associated domain-containing protein [archaeon]